MDVSLDSAGKGSKDCSGGKSKGRDVVLGEFYGTIKNYNIEKGFGFVTCKALSGKGQGDVYLHKKHIREFQVVYYVFIQKL